MLWSVPDWDFWDTLNVNHYPNFFPDCILFPYWCIILKLRWTHDCLMFLAILDIHKKNIIKKIRRNKHHFCNLFFLESWFSFWSMSLWYIFSTSDQLCGFHEMRSLEKKLSSVFGKLSGKRGNQEKNVWKICEKSNLVEQ